MNTRSSSSRRRSRSPQRGGVLVACLLLLGLLTVLVGSLYRTTIPELVSSAFHSRQNAAFYNAEAGIQCIIQQVSVGVRDGTLTLTNLGESVNFTAPPGYSFDPVTHINLLPNHRWMTFTVTGRYQNAKAVLEATVARPRLLKNAGIFGDVFLDMQPNGEIFSYDSRDLPFPLRDDSTGEANVGSNHGINIQPGVSIDGLVFLGDDQLMVPVGYEYEYTGPIEKDPLGALNGPLATAFTKYSDAANNNNSDAGIVNNRLRLGPGDIFTLPGGNYYLTELYMPANSTLIANGTPGNPVVIYLHGEMKVQPNAAINTTNGLPSNLFIFSNDTEPLTVQPNGDFRAFVYAPYASVNVQPNVSAYGVFWGKDVTLKPNIDIFIDISLLDRFLSSSVELVEWRQIVDD